MILLTGVTGHLGKAALEQMLKHLSPSEFAILARDEQKVKTFADKGIEVRLGDFDNKESLDKAFKGISKLLLIPSIAPHRLEQNKNVIDAAGKNGVNHIIYTGVSFKNIEQSETPGLDAHFKTEEYIRESGMKYTFLRNTLYTDGLPMFAGDKVFETGIYLPAGNGKVPYALRREMGEAAANVLLQEGHENKVYEITGSEMYSYFDVADVLASLSGKMVKYTPAEPALFGKQLKAAGVDDFIIFILTGFNLDIRNEQYEIITNDLEKLLGRKPAGLEEGLLEVFDL